MEHRSAFGIVLRLAIGCAAMMALGCDNPLTHMDMENGARLKPYEPSSFFEDGSSSRPLLPGTVARGMLQTDDAIALGVGPDGQPVATSPVPVDIDLVRRGQERYGISCTPCHGAIGDGQGMVVQRGFSRPPSFHIDRLRTAPDGHLFQVITNGIGRMPSYANQVEPRDRWAIVAYVRALQLSQSVRPEDLRSGNLATSSHGAPEGTQR